MPFSPIRMNAKRCRIRDAWRVFLIACVGGVLVGCSGAGGQDSSFRTIELPLAVGEEVMSIAVIHNQRHRGLNGFAVALGDGGSAIYNMDGTEVWRDMIPARLVAYDGRALLVYRDHEERTILDRYSATDRIYIGYEDRQMPSEIAPTTLQRTAFSSLGSITLSGREVRLPSEDFSETRSFKSKRDVAAVASTNKPLPYYPDGVVAIASADGHIDLMSVDEFKSRLR